MKTINDYGKMFENILIFCLGKPTDGVYFSTYYNNHFKTTALLYAVCTKERHINSKEYSQEELDQIYSLQDGLSKDGSYKTIYKTISFFAEKMNLKL